MTLPIPCAPAPAAAARPARSGRAWRPLMLAMPLATMLLAACAGGPASSTAAPVSTADSRAAERTRLDAELASAQAEASAARTRAEGLQRELEQLRAAPVPAAAGRRP